MNDTLLQLHWVAQLGDAFAKASAAPHPMWHHVALRVDESAWTTVPSATNHLRLAIRPSEAALELGMNERPPATFALQQRTLTQALAWIESSVPAGTLAGPLALRDPSKMPPHPIGTQGAAIELDLGVAQKEQRRYARASSILGRVVEPLPNAGPVLLWPHHFDVSSMVTIAKGTKADHEDARTITLGRSPGDSAYDHAYWYVTPWPYPETEQLPEIEAGTWHTSGWVGAVLMEGGDEGDDAGSFLRHAYDALFGLMDRSGRV